MRHFGLAGVCLCLAAVVPASAQTYVVGNRPVGTNLGGLAFDPRTDCLWAADSDGRLVRIDPATRSSKVVGEIGFSHVKSLAMDPDGGVLYGLSSGWLIGIDPVTGAGFPIADLAGYPYYWVDALAFDRARGTLVGARWEDWEVNMGTIISVLYIDPLTGEGTYPQTCWLPDCAGFMTGFRGLTYDENSGLLYALSEYPNGNWPLLFRIDPVAGEVVGCPCHEADFDLSGIAFDPARGMLYGVTVGVLGLSYLAGIDTATAEARLLLATAPGADFADIQPAIDASRGGDTLLVLPGSYRSFVLEKGIRILGSPSGRVSVGLSRVERPGGSTSSERLRSAVANVRVGETAVLSDLEFPGLRVERCGGSVLLRDVATRAEFAALTVRDSADVRVHGASVETLRGPEFGGPTAAGLFILTSRVELVRSRVEGGAGWCYEDPDHGGIGDPDHCWGQDYCPGEGDFTTGFGDYSIDGGAGVWVENGQLYVALSDLIEGPSSACYGSAPGGGLILTSGSHAVVAGTQQDVIQGVVWVSSDSSLRASGVTMPNGVGGTGTIETPLDPDPVLEILESGSRRSGVIACRVLGTPGALLTMLVGASPAQVPTPGTLVDLLVDPIREVEVGAVGADGQAIVELVVPWDWPDEVLYLVQAELLRPDGELARTHSAMPRLFPRNARASVSR